MKKITKLSDLTPVIDKERCLNSYKSRTISLYETVYVDGNSFYNPFYGESSNGESSKQWQILTQSLTEKQINNIACVSSAEQYYLKPRSYTTDSSIAIDAAYNRYLNKKRLVDSVKNFIKFYIEEVYSSEEEIVDLYGYWRDAIKLEDVVNSFKTADTKDLVRWYNWTLSIE